MIAHTQYFRGRYPPFDEGVFCKSFLVEAAVEELWEMKELICRYSSKSSLDQKYGRNVEVLQEHNIDNVFMILDHEFGRGVMPAFFEMIGFDALIGHGDRHWSNYGVVVSGRPVKARFAPLYDTASGYLVEHEENDCRIMLKDDLNDPEWYRPRLKGLCKITVPNDIKANHFDLLEHILVNSDMRRYTPCLQKAFSNFHPGIVRAILNRFFSELSPIRCEVIEKILTMRWQIGRNLFKNLGV